MTLLQVFRVVSSTKVSRVRTRVSGPTARVTVGPSPRLDYTGKIPRGAEGGFELCPKNEAGDLCDGVPCLFCGVPSLADEFRVVGHPRRKFPMDPQTAGAPIVA